MSDELKNLDRVILWQYDNAEYITSIIDILKELYTKSVDQFWNELPDYLRLDAPSLINEYGLTIWGKILNIDNSDTKPRMYDKPSEIQFEWRRKLTLAVLKYRLSGTNKKSFEDLYYSLTGQKYGYDFTLNAFESRNSCIRNAIWQEPYVDNNDEQEYYYSKIFLEMYDQIDCTNMFDPWISSFIGIGTMFCFDFDKDPTTGKKMEEKEFKVGGFDQGAFDYQVTPKGVMRK